MVNNSSLLARIVAAADPTADPDDFLNPRLADLPGLENLPGLKQGGDILARAIIEGRPVAIFGDYDADGVTATALMASFVQACGGTVFWHLPNRLTEGYGVDRDAVERVAGRVSFPAALVTVDCGTSSGEALVLARELGFTTVVTDHHRAEKRPDGADCIINPNLGSTPGFEVLAGAGVAFFLAAATRAALRELGFFQKKQEPDLRALLDLVALGAIADMVPLTGINRILTRAGIDRMNQAPRPGLAALMQAAGLACGHVGGRDVSFVIAPRINAAGRMGEAETALELLLEKDPARIRSLCQRLEQLNRERRELTDKALELIEKTTETQKVTNETIAIFKAGEIHLGVVGLVAARLMRELDRPVLVFSLDNGVAVGSGRAPDGYDLFAMLEPHSAMFTAFGGHSQACGLTMPQEKIAELESRLAANRWPRQEQKKTAPIEADMGELFAPGFLENYERLEPFGQGNPQPLFTASLKVLPDSVARVGQASLRFAVGDGNGNRLPAIAFNAAEQEGRLGHNSIRAAFRLDRNHFRGRAEWQVVVEAFHDPAPEASAA